MPTRGDARRGARSGARRIAWPPTLAAKRAQPFDVSHLRFRPEIPRGGALHCFVLDCSGSMMSGRQLAHAKGLLVALFDQVGASRDDAVLICFGGARADVRFGPAIPRWWNERWLEPVGGGGGTPLAHGIRAARTVLARAARRRPAQQRWLWLLTDGRSADRPARPPEADRTVLVDFERGAVRLGRCAALADAWDGLYLTPDDLLG
ncbi:magnesium chelatase subunit ChlD-like protein [Paraburkholderia caballeronis]|uniref:vWA domain-containing protein n=1 Tax=Paraburkholderia caballeronis TaxID=416943 RepID=UPI001066F35F|nr:VWA domain-containing protein [Paraburkholderia caballeronis]TDV25587.1 magnesium chelatase subunit ChlD-like protein [Paraburkholderia caballeronis]